VVRSTLIWQLTAVTVLGFVLIGLGQLYARRPVIKLALLRNRTFAAVFVLALILGVVLYGTAYVIPQFLAAIAGYNAMQAGQVVFISGIPAMMMMPLFPILLSRFDLRLIVATGLLLMMASCYIDTSLTADSTGSDFVDSQLLRGLGQVLSMMFLNQAAIAAVRPDEAGDASGLFNAARNLGGSIGLALLATVQERRLDYHHWTLNSAGQQRSCRAGLGFQHLRHVRRRSGRPCRRNTPDRQHGAARSHGDGVQRRFHVPCGGHSRGDPARPFPAPSSQGTQHGGHALMRPIPELSSLPCSLPASCSSAAAPRSGQTTMARRTWRIPLPRAAVSCARTTEPAPPRPPPAGGRRWEIPCSTRLSKPR
jgi:hypothetical protein